MASTKKTKIRYRNRDVEAQAVGRARLKPKPVELDDEFPFGGDVDGVDPVARDPVHDFMAQAEVSQNLKYHLFQTDGWQGLDGHTREAIEVIVRQLAKVVTGSPEPGSDAWIEIERVAKLAAQGAWR